MTTFSDLVACGVLAIGDGYRAKNEELGDEGPIFLRSAYLQDNGWMLDRPDRLARKPSGGFGPKVAQVDDAVLTTKGNSLGRLGLVNSKVAGSVYSPHLSYWRSLRPSELSPRYLYYWAHSTVARDQIRARSESTDMAPYLSLSDQLALWIELPPIGVQLGIIELLGALDDKIVLNRRMTETLEEIARALFQSWFVDFDPVHAKVEGRPTGLPDDLAALFPYSLSEDGLPEEWAEGSIADLVTINPTTPLKMKDAPYIDMAALPTTGSRISRVVARAPGSGARFRNGDTLIARITPCIENGKTALVDCLDDDAVGWGSTEFIVLRPKEGTPRALPYLIARHQPFRENLIAAMSGTSGRQRVQADAVTRWPLAIPTAPALDVFAMITDRIFSRITSLGRESDTLAALRDTLLPKLISGELCFVEAERRIAAA